MKYQGNIQRVSMITKFDGISGVAAFRKENQVKVTSSL